MKYNWQVIPKGTWVGREYKPMGYYLVAWEGNCRVMSLETKIVKVNA